MGYFRKLKNVTNIDHNESYEGETIEQKVERFVNGGEPIKDSAPLIYTEREEGVRPEYNIRTDRWEIGLDAMDYVSRSERAKTIEMYPKKEEKDASSEPTQTSNNDNK